MTDTRNLKLTIAYDGKNYHGFQRQKNALGVQQILEERLSKAFRENIKITGAARTDAKVHAYGQVIILILVKNHGINLAKISKSCVSCS